jgi:hypothetical protein
MPAYRCSQALDSIILGMEDDCWVLELPSPVRSLVYYCFFWCGGQRRGFFIVTSCGSRSLFLQLRISSSAFRYSRGTWFLFGTQ